MSVHGLRNLVGVLALGAALARERMRQRLG